MLRSLLLSAFLAGCTLGVAYVPDAYYVPCEETQAPISFCEQYYYWVGPHWSWPYNVWHPGHYVIREGWHRPVQAGPIHPPAPYPAVRDHRQAPQVRDHRR